MKKFDWAPTYFPPKTSRGLLARIDMLLNADLADPLIERHARNLLKTARKFGYKFENASELDDCLACLHLSLMSAADAISSPLH